METVEKTEEIKTYTPSEEEKKDQKMVFDRFDNMKKGQERKEAEDHWKDAEMLDAGDTGETRDEDDWRSNIFFNITSPAILTALQEIIEAPPVYNPTPGGKDDIPKAPIMAVIMKYTLYQSDYLKELVKIFHTALKYGVAFVQEYNKEDPRVIQELKDYDFTMSN